MCYSGCKYENRAGGCSKPYNKKCPADIDEKIEEIEKISEDSVKKFNSLDYLDYRELICAIESGYSIAKRLHEKDKCTCEKENDNITILCKCSYLRDKKNLDSIKKVILQHEVEIVVDKL